MNLSDFDYPLPEELIAQQPLEDRSASRMLVLDRKAAAWRDGAFRDLPTYLGPGDCLALEQHARLPLPAVRADARARFPCRWGRTIPNGAKTCPATWRCFCCGPYRDDHLTWRALVRPGARCAPGERVRFTEGVGGGDGGARRIRRADGPVPLRKGHLRALEEVGHVPLPPYIHRADGEEDRERYQTVFARRDEGRRPRPPPACTSRRRCWTRAGGGAPRGVTSRSTWGWGHFSRCTPKPLKQNKLHSEPFELDAEEEARSCMERADGLWPWAPPSPEHWKAWRRKIGLRRAGAKPTCSSIRIPVSGRGSPADQLPPPEIEPAAAGKRLCRTRADTGGLPARGAAEAYRFFSYGDCMLIL